MSPSAAGNQQEERSVTSPAQRRENGPMPSRGNEPAAYESTGTVMSLGVPSGLDIAEVEIILKGRGSVTNCKGPSSVGTVIGLGVPHG